MNRMSIREIFAFLRACQFDPRKHICTIHQSKGYVIVSSRPR